MNINATLIIQVVNFFIAYFLFRFILLKPAYAVIVEEQETKALLEQLILDDKRLIEQRERERIHQWRDSYAFFQKNMPASINYSTFFKGTAPHIKLKPLDATIVAEAKETMVHAIVKVAGVYHDQR